MKKTYKTFLIIILVLPFLLNMISLGSSPITTIEYKMNVVSYTPSGAIDIDGNQDFDDTAEAEGWPGSGTVDDPYVISGLNISSTSLNQIDIRDTTAYYQIKNCYIAYQPPGGPVITQPIGIQLSNTTNGYIENNTYKSISPKINVKILFILTPIILIIKAYIKNFRNWDIRIVFYIKILCF